MSENGVYVCKDGIADMEIQNRRPGRQELKGAFIELRAKGYSLDRCSKLLTVAKATLCNWSRELEADIARLRAIELEALQEEFLVAKEARIRLLGEQLQAIRQELKARGLADVSTARLLELQLSYYQELLAEFVEVRHVSEQDMEDLQALNQ